MMRDIKIGATYRHFSGNYYRVLYIAIDSVTNEEVVVYETLGNNHTVWTRPLSLFNERVDQEKYPDTMQVYKFEPISDNIGD